MLMKIVHHKVGKDEWGSHECYLFNENMFDITDPTDFRGRGETKKEAIEDLKKQLKDYFDELHALEKMLYETDVLDNDVFEIDRFGRLKKGE